jgi:N-acetylglutamate synthase-like GNAT family acetyltransferase
MEERRGELLLTDDLARMDIGTIHGWLANEAYWAKGRSFEVVAASLRQSHTYGVLNGERQIAVARTITDGVTFAYLCDVFVEELSREKQIGSWMLKRMISDLREAKISQVLLATRDAHRFYSRSELGFHPLTNPDRWLEVNSIAESPI